MKFVPGVSPFTTATEPRGERGNQVILALGRLTRLEARLLGAEGHWDQVAEHCAGTLEVALDHSHLNLIGAMVASGAVRSLAGPCANALPRVSPEARKPGPRSRHAFPACLRDWRRTTSTSRRSGS